MTTQPNKPVSTLAYLVARRQAVISLLAILGIGLYLSLRFVFHLNRGTAQGPLLVVLFAGGIPLLIELGIKLKRLEFGSDLLAGISIMTAILLHEWLAGAIVVLMLAGGETLENYAVRNASKVLRALAERMPSIAHRKRGFDMHDIAVDEIEVGDRLVIFPHEICPVDGTVVEGHARMDESFLTGEPFQISKAPGSLVISGAINGESGVTISATKRAVDSRYAKIMEVMHASEQNRPRLRRLGDQLGAIYTPVAVFLAVMAWVFSGEAIRFLAVLVIATPCPLLIAIPVAIIASISLSARRGIIVKNPIILEQINHCRTVIFDKTGTLTYGEPELTEQIIAPGFSRAELLAQTASLELYSKHPLAKAFLAAAKREAVSLRAVNSVSEPPGQGLRGSVNGRSLEITSRKKVLSQSVVGREHLPSASSGLECIVVVDGRYAATYRFRDTPRSDGFSFIKHLGPKHRFTDIMIVSGDRESEVRYLADQVGISEIHAQKNPKEKLSIVQSETAKAKTLYVGDGINDAPAMMAATVGVAVGQNSDITAEAAGAVVMDGQLRKIDELMHISQRQRSIALQSAIGGMALSIGGMMLAALGFLTPVEGALSQEIIDVLAIANALRAAFPPKRISDFPESPSIRKK